MNCGVFNISRDERRTGFAASDERVMPSEQEAVKLGMKYSLVASDVLELSFFEDP